MVQRLGEDEFNFGRWKDPEALRNLHIGYKMSPTSYIPIQCSFTQVERFRQRCLLATALHGCITPTQRPVGGCANWHTCDIDRYKHEIVEDEVRVQTGYTTSPILYKQATSLLRTERRSRTLNDSRNPCRESGGPGTRQKCQTNTINIAYLLYLPGTQ